MRRFSFLFPLLAALASCGSSSDQVVKASEFGESWPFNTEQVTLRCIGQARMVEVSGIAYALNGQALDGGLQRPDAVLNGKADNFAQIGKLTERSAALCDK